MIPVAYFISGHGYGHAVRSSQVIRSLKEACPDLDIHVRTAAPRWFFLDLPFSVFCEKRAIDVGILQSDSLGMRLVDTLHACQELHQRLPALVEENLAFIKQHKIRLIIGDIPPLCFEIARRASLPSVAIGNFTWDWIYRAYLSDLPAFLPLIQEMASSYREASLALCLPFSCDMEIFPVKKPIPLISRLSSLDKAEARKRFGLPAGATIVLVSFGGFGLAKLPWERLSQLGDFFFVTTGSSPRKENNLLVLPEELPHYEDLIRAADVVVSKPGYGIVADVIAHQVPFLYTSRGDFPEYPYLVGAMNSWATCELIPQKELLAGNLQPYLKRLLEREAHWPAVALNGAEVAVVKILELL
ncbi:MAG: hypothetical protein HYY45_00070 [Deltaproteobacteria bacterium]|nr:hypothetical protein [Deltaproteobacteria bacterium]